MKAETERRQARCEHVETEGHVNNVGRAAYRRPYSSTLSIAKQKQLLCFD